MAVLANAKAVIIRPYLHVPNQHIAHLKLTQYCMLITLHLKKMCGSLWKKDKAVYKGTIFTFLKLELVQSVKNHWSEHR